MVRSDLQHLIIDVGRSHCGETHRFRDDDMDLDRGPMRNVHGKYSGDRLAPRRGSRQRWFRPTTRTRRRRHRRSVSSFRSARPSPR